MLPFMKRGSEFAVDDERWQAIVERDKRRDGSFVYAVATTGIYCRPSCPSRRPHRQNVGVYATPDAAESAGFRACHRCQPRSESGTLIDICVEAARAYIDAHVTERVGLRELAAHTGVSPYHLQRAFKARFGVSPKQYLRTKRLERFKATVQTGAPVTQSLYDAGFGSPRGLYSKAAAGLGMTPGRYRRGGEGALIRYAISPCRFGLVLVGTTERGVCAVLLGDTERALERQLAEEFPRATRVRAAEGEGIAEETLLAFDGAASPTLDLSGTDFQRRVWTALQAIPRGETRSYEQLSAELGSPQSVRAVARACATNKIAILVPCHRVIRKDGNLAGYRWGLPRKKRILQIESAEIESGGLSASSTEAKEAHARRRGRASSRSRDGHASNQ